MVKSRMATIDVRAMAENIRKEVLNHRLMNIYDITNKVYAFKFAKAGVEGKTHLLVESGIRVHTTNWERDKTAIPSRLTLKLKKHLRAKRLDSVEQLGCDRVLDFKFVGTDGVFHLLMEFYVRGNLILTDQDYKVLMLLRHAKMEDEDDSAMTLAIGSTYPVEKARAMPYFQGGVTMEKVQAGDSEATAVALETAANLNGSPVKNRELVMRLLTFAHPALAEHGCIAAGLNPLVTYRKSDPDAPYLTDDGAPIDWSGICQALLKCVETYEATAPSLRGEEEAPMGKGYLKVKSFSPEAAPIPEGGVEGTQASREFLEAGGWAVEEFTPVILSEATKEMALAAGQTLQEGKKKKKVEAESMEGYIGFDSFSEAIDNFYARLETQKADRAMESKNAQLSSRMEKIKEDQQRRLDALLEVQRLAEKQADLLEMNAIVVEACIEMMRALMDEEEDWGQVERTVKEAAREGHPLAQRIHKMDLAHTKIWILLGEETEEDEEDFGGEMDGSEMLLDVEVDFSQSCYANVALHHQLRKQGKVKLAKTEVAAAKAIKEAERRTEAEKAKEALKIQKAQILERRKVFWFEKFRWFVSSENYLVLAGRDATQNDMLYRRYLEKNDIYVHADIVGAATCIIKNPTGAEVPPRTLQEAGQFSVCYSNAWTNKRQVPAYWVTADQVSKTAPSGEFLTPGAFMIRGKKNFLPPANLEMGFAILFHLAPQSMARHAGERDKRLHIAEELTGGKRVAGIDKYLVSKRADGKEEDSDAEDEDEEVESEIEQETQEDQEAASEQDCQDEAAAPSTVAPAVPKEEFTITEVAPSLSQLKAEKAKIQEQLKKEKEAAKNAKAANQGKKGAKDAGKKGGKEEEKKKNKKGKRRGDDSEDEVTAFAQEDASKQHAPKDTKAAALAQLPRGQRSKLKKIQDKYGDQDEDERAFRLGLVGSKAMQRIKLAGLEDDEDAAQLATEEADEAVLEAQRKQEEEAALAAKRQANKEKKERREVRALGMEDEEMSAELAARLKEIDQLTGVPHVQDILLAAVPVCGPYLALSQYPFKVKLTPGKEKKGKVIQAAVKLMMQNRYALPNPDLQGDAAVDTKAPLQALVGQNKGKQVQTEGVPAQALELIRHLDVDAAQHSLIADIKISAAGVTAIKVADRKERKVNAKANAQGANDF